MSSVQFLSWKQDIAKEISYPDIKAAYETRKKRLNKILEEFSVLGAGTIVHCREQILASKGAMIPTSNLDRAEELASALMMLGAEVRVREMDNANVCEYCKTFTVLEIAQEPAGFRVYCCAKCNEIKRACPKCSYQGWIYHYEVDNPPLHRYTCDECLFT